MKIYEKYKTINLPWLSKIPAHWGVHRNKNVFVEQKEEVGQYSDDYRLLSLTLRGIVPRDMDGGGKFPSSFEKYKVVKKVTWLSVSLMSMKLHELLLSQSMMVC